MAFFSIGNLRIGVMVWLIFSFLITASYSGNLRAFLMTPERDKPIESIQDLFESGLNWNSVDYSLVDLIVQNTPDDQKLQEFWKEKEVAEYEDYIYKRVNFHTFQVLQRVQLFSAFERFQRLGSRRGVPISDGDEHFHRIHHHEWPKTGAHHGKYPARHRQRALHLQEVQLSLEGTHDDGSGQVKTIVK